MSQNYYRGPIQTSGRVGRPYRVENVNRAGKSVKPVLGRPKTPKNLVNAKIKQIYTASFQNKSATGNRKKINLDFKIRGKVAMKHRNPLPIKTRGAFFGGLQPIPTDPSVDPAPHVCYNCWKPNHNHKNCSQPKNRRFCRNCGRRDKDLRTCPRCKRVYGLYLQMVESNKHNELVNQQFIEPSFDELGFGTPIYSNLEAEPEVEVSDPALQKFINQNQTNHSLLAYQRQYEQQQHHHHDYVDDEVQHHLSSAPVYNEIFYAEDDVETMLDNVPNDSYYKYNGNEKFLNKRRPSQQERHIGLAVFKEHQESMPVPPNVGVSHWETEKQRTTRSSISPALPQSSSSSWHRDVPDSTNTDPVEDILKLAKTISHLSCETQDLVMRQVIAERKNRARQRTETYEMDNDI